MDAKANPATPLFKEEHVGKTITVKPKATSSERAKFVELAKKRMNRAIKDIRRIGQLDRMPGLNGEDVMVMAEALVFEVNAMRNRLVLASDREPDFQLGGEGEG